VVIYHFRAHFLGRPTGGVKSLPSVHAMRIAHGWTWSSEFKTRNNSDLEFVEYFWLKLFLVLKLASIDPMSM
jgi:hypothetical protein